ncbi:MAG: TetR/AcrR family transcriptional regulator [Leptospiraceae bacterium]|nr:TetR/AcrR family transcriptional regulator [Leptospiraceae bacterium]MCB1199711.1 TetR/AcrR family transcriptional regulator [Leptospiraceae bacterium]
MKKNKQIKTELPNNDDLREAVLAESLKILSKEGPYNLSLRKVARNLSVSHAAPYRHFKSKEHILAELTTHAFELFKQYLQKDLPPIYETEKLEERFIQMGENYFQFARDYSDLYRFMFGPKVFDMHSHPEVLKCANSSFLVLHEHISAMQHQKLIAGTDAQVSSMFVFSAMHGMASLMLNGAIEDIVADEKTRQNLTEYMKHKVLRALKESE